MMAKKILVLFLTLVLSHSIQEPQISNTTTNILNVPVVYVMFGKFPHFFKFNVEIASRHNPVVLITDSDSEDWLNRRNRSVSRYPVVVEPLHRFMSSADALGPKYVHYSRDMSQNRQRHELRCVQRWFVLRDYMDIRNVSRAFFGDGDVAVFASMQSAAEARGNCSAVINVEVQQHDFHWVGAGETSLWTKPAVNDFCTFAEKCYDDHRNVLAVKFNTHHSSVVDMSLLWLWWVAHTRKYATGWETGRPYHTEAYNGGVRTTETNRLASDAALDYSRKLPLPPVDQAVNICNGLDVVARTVFDHMHGWNACSNFSLGLEGSGQPRCVGASLATGGRPELLSVAETVAEPKAAQAEYWQHLENEALYLLAIHYQGGTKHLLPYDVCRVLLLTGDRTVALEEVAELCAKEIATRRRERAGAVIQPEQGSILWPCMDHPTIGEQSAICI